MPLLRDRVRETTTTVGTGTITLGGAVTGYQSFNTAFTNGDTTYYVIQGGTEWEIGIGTIGAGTLARTTVLQSSNADALVPFSAGTKDVFCSYVADRAVTTSDAATLTNKTLDDYTNNVGANSTHFRIKATGTISKGQVVKAIGFTPGEQAIEVAVVSSATDLALGIAESALTTGQFGLAVVIGELFDVNTNGLSVGAILYSNGTGGYTTTKPSSGTYQPLGWVVRANLNNGVIAVNIVAPLYVETSTNTANTAVLRDGSGNFAAGTITATLNGAAPAGSLTGTTLASNVVSSSLTSVGTLSSLTVSGNLTVDTNTLFVDSANNRVGVGTVTPSTALEISGNSATTGPSLRLANQSNTMDAGAVIGTMEFFSGDDSGGDAVVASIQAVQPLTTPVTGSLLFKSGNNTTGMVLDASGNVGIGTTSPAYRLDVQNTGNTLARVGGSGTGQAGFYVASGGAFAPFILFQSSGTTTEAGINAPPGTGSLVFTTGALSTSRWTINSSGHFLASTDASFDIGASGANRPRNLFLSGTATMGGTLTVTAQNAANFTSGSAATRSYIGLGTSSVGAYVGVAGSSGGLIGGSAANDLEIAADSNAIRFSAGNSRASANMILDASGKLGIGTASPIAQLANTNTTDAISVSNPTGFAWRSTANDWAGVIISRPASGLSYGLRVHSGGTSATDYPFGVSSGAGSGSFLMAVTGAGNVGIGTTTPAGRLHVTASGVNSIFDSGAAADGRIELRYNGVRQGLIGFDSGIVNIRADLSSVLRLGAGNADRWSISTAGHFLAITDASFDIGASGANRPRDLYLSRDLILGSVAYASRFVATSDVTVNDYIEIRANDAELYLANAAQTRNYNFRLQGNDLLLRHYNGTSMVDFMAVTTAGNVGIGTTSPAVRLHVKGTADTGSVLRLEPATSTTIYSQVRGNNGDLVLDADPGNAEGSTSIKFHVDNTERMRLDASGNLGLGVAPSAWSGYKALELGRVGLGLWQTGNSAGFTSNAYNNAGWKYATTATAALYEINTGVHNWYNAPSGTAGNAVTFTQAMTLDSNGRLLVGTATSPSSGNVRNVFATSSGAFTQWTNTSGGGSGGVIGAGATGSLEVYTHTGAVGSETYTKRWEITSAGHLLAGADATYDIGASGANRPRDLFIGRNLSVNGTTDLKTATWLTFGGNNVLYSDTTSGTILQATTTADQIRLRSADGTERVRVKSGGQVRFVPLATAPTTNVEDGDVYYDSGTNKLRVRAGGAWVDLH